MFDLHVENDRECLHAAEQIVQKVDTDYHSTGYRISALDLLPQFRGLAPEESAQVFRLVIERLGDPEPTVRMQASQALTNLSNPGAIPYLSIWIAPRAATLSTLWTHFHSCADPMRGRMGSTGRNALSLTSMTACSAPSKPARHTRQFSIHRLPIELTSEAPRKKYLTPDIGQEQLNLGLD
jgi:hypothetical protein